MQTAPVDGVEFRVVETNGIRMRVAVAGTGPLVVLAHGWPDSWYSWRHQIAALTAAGYRVAAPDMRGYGETDKPDAVEAYDIVTLAADIVGLVDALDAERAHLVGHDWGSIVAAHTALFHPQRLASLTLMSVPHHGRPAASPMSIFAELFGDDFFYVLYHNEPGGVAEREYDADPRGLLSRLYLSPDSPRHDPEVTDPARVAGGWIPRLGAPKGLPTWLTAADLDYVVGLFEQAGFRGGLNYYRNLDRNWELTEPYADTPIEVPTLFVAGDLDAVIGGADAATLRDNMAAAVADLRDVVLLEGAGHWVQQEAAGATSETLRSFLDSIEAAG